MSRVDMMAAIAKRPQTAAEVALHVKTSRQTVSGAMLDFRERGLAVVVGSPRGTGGALTYAATAAGVKWMERKRTEQRSPRIQRHIVERAAASPVLAAQIAREMAIGVDRVSSAIQRCKQLGYIESIGRTPGQAGARLWKATRCGRDWLARPRTYTGSVKSDWRPKRASARLADMPDLPDTPPDDGYGSGGRIALEMVWR